MFETLLKKDEDWLKTGRSKFFTLRIPFCMPTLDFLSMLYHHKVIPQCFHYSWIRRCVILGLNI